MDLEIDSPHVYIYRREAFFLPVCRQVGEKCSKIPLMESPIPLDVSERARSLAKEARLSSSIWFYFADDTRDEAVNMMAIAKKNGIHVLTREILKISEVDSLEDKTFFRNTAGEILIFPSQKLLNEEPGVVKFLFAVNDLRLGGMAQAILVFTNDENFKYAGWEGEQNLSFQLSGKPRMYGEMEAPGVEAFPGWLKAVKSRRLGK